MTNDVVCLDGRVVRYERDRVGNDLTAVLKWCSTHTEPVWIYSDGDYICPHTRVVLVDTHDHEITSPPWERLG